MTELCEERKTTINRLVTLSGITQYTIENLMKGKTENPKLASVTHKLYNTLIFHVYKFMEGTMIQGKEGLLGLFLIIMGLSMFLMCLVYYKTRKMGYAWMSFGLLYTFGILMLMTDNPIKSYLNVSLNSNF